MQLLTREGEVEICKRIEQGENAVLAAVAGSQTAIQAILSLGSELKDGKLALNEILRGYDDVAADESQKKRVLEQIDEIARRDHQSRKLVERQAVQS